MKFVIFVIFTLIPNISFSGATGEVLGDTAKGAAVGGVVGGLASKAGQKVIGEEAAKGLGDFFNSPPGILTVSSIATVYSGTLYSAAAAQEEDAENNIKKIDRIMAEFKDSYAFYCPAGRDDLSNPECYCYLAEGGENPNRTKSKTCQDLWAKNKFKIVANAGNYNGVAKFTDPVGCLTLNGQFDENCKCKKFVDAKGNNACKKNISVTLPGGFAAPLMANSGLKDVMQFAANTANGNPMFNNFGTASLGVKAIASDKLREQILSKLGAKSGSAPIQFVNEKNVAQLAKAIFGEKAIAEAMAKNSGSALNSAASEQKDKGAEDLLKAAAAKAGIESYGSGRGLSNKKPEAKDGMNFNFMGEQANAASATQNFPEQEKNYSYKGSDINKAPDTSIFEIISNRYIQSGLRRLFDEEKK